jgi:hypothetical protein
MSYVSYGQALGMQKQLYIVFEEPYKDVVFRITHTFSMVYSYKVNNAQKMLKKSIEILKKCSRSAVLRRLLEYFA